MTWVRTYADPRKELLWRTFCDTADLLRGVRRVAGEEIPVLMWSMSQRNGITLTREEGYKMATALMKLGHRVSSHG